MARLLTLLSLFLLVAVPNFGQAGRFIVQSLDVSVDQFGESGLPLCVQVGVFFELTDGGGASQINFNQFEIGIGWAPNDPNLVHAVPSVFGANANGGSTMPPVNGPGLTNPPTAQMTFDGEQVEFCNPDRIVNSQSLDNGPDLPYLNLGIPPNGPQDVTGLPQMGGSIRVRSFGNILGERVTIAEGERVLVAIVSFPLNLVIGEIDLGFPPVPTNFVADTLDGVLIRFDQGNLDFQNGYVRVSPLNPSVPTLGQWSLIFLTGSFLLMGLHRLRKAKRKGLVLARDLNL